MTKLISKTAAIAAAALICAASAASAETTKKIIYVSKSTGEVIRTVEVPTRAQAQPNAPTKKRLTTKAGRTWNVGVYR